MMIAWAQMGRGRGPEPMSTTRAALTDGDIQSLMRGATIDERAAAAHKLCRKIDETVLTDEDRQVAQDILRVMAADAAELVRRALAVTLKASPMVPRDVAMQLARDVESVATPILSASPVFTDEDLVEIIRFAGPVRQIAIATRVSLPETVTAALVEHGAEAAVRTACANDNAHFAEMSLQKAISRFANSQQLLAAVAYRQALPPSVAERLVNMVTDQVRDHLINHHALPAETALQIAVGARERATIDIVDQAGRAADMERFVEHMRLEGRPAGEAVRRLPGRGGRLPFDRVRRRAARSAEVPDPDAGALPDPADGDPARRPGLSAREDGSPPGRAQKGLA